MKGQQQLVSSNAISLDQTYGYEMVNCSVSKPGLLERIGYVPSVEASTVLFNASSHL
jgi:hypothetical protein